MISTETTVKVPKDIGTKAARYIAAALDRIAGEAQRVARQEAPANTGQLANSILLFRQHVPPSFSAGIETNLPYALVMERGRRPGTWPNIGAIERWVFLKRREFITTGSASSLKTRKSVRGLTGANTKGLASSLKNKRTIGGNKAMEQVRRLAFVIARSIKNKGIKGRAYFFKAEQHVVALLGDAAEQIGISIKAEWDQGGK